MSGKWIYGYGYKHVLQVENLELRNEHIVRRVIIYDTGLYK